MASPGIPTNFIAQQANRNIYLSWNMSVGADSYEIQRSLDNITYTNLVTISGSPLATKYEDSSVTAGIQYWYKIRSFIGLAASSYTNPQIEIPVPTSEMSLLGVRNASKQKADRVNSNFVTMYEWNTFINLAMYELYDLLVTVFEDYYSAQPIQFACDGSTYRYALPNGLNTFTNADTGATFTPRPFYKLLGVDLALNNATNAYVTVNKFNFIDRNRFVYPNTASTIYGVFNLQYRTMGDSIEFIPTPSAGQNIRIWYIPRLLSLVVDTDITTIGFSGWLNYVIVRAAKYALDKEESDTSKLDAELLFLKARIEETASNRDAGQPDTISDTRLTWGSSGNGPGFNGGSAGF